MGPMVVGCQTSSGFEGLIPTAHVLQPWFLGSFSQAEGVFASQARGGAVGVSQWSLRAKDRDSHLGVALVERHLGV